MTTLGTGATGFLGSALTTEFETSFTSGEPCPLTP